MFARYPSRPFSVTSCSSFGSLVFEVGISTNLWTLKRSCWFSNLLVVLNCGSAPRGWSQNWCRKVFWSCSQLTSSLDWRPQYPVSVRSVFSEEHKCTPHQEGKIPLQIRIRQHFGPEGKLIDRRNIFRLFCRRRECDGSGTVKQLLHAT